MKPTLILFDIDYTLFDTDLLKSTDLKVFRPFEEVPHVLTTLSDKCKMGILSEGELQFQTEKLQRTDILHFFDTEYIHIVDNKIERMPDILKKYTNDYQLIIVDDRLEILQKAKTEDISIYVLWVKRGTYALNQPSLDDFKADLEVTTLKNIVSFVTNL